MARSKVCVVIGAGDATGGAIARRFAREGYTAVVTRRSADKLKHLVAQITEEGGKVHPFGSDARDEEQVVKLFREIETEIGEIEVFVFNIGGNVRFDIRDTTSSRLSQGLGDDGLRRLFDGARGRQGDGAARPRHHAVHRSHGEPARRPRLLGLRRRQACGARARPIDGARARAAEHPRSPRRDRRRHRHRMDQGEFPRALQRRPRCHPQSGRHRRGLLAAPPQKRSAWTFEMDLRPWKETW